MSAQSPSRCIGNGTADHNGQFCFVVIAKIFLDCENGPFCIQGIKNGFNQYNIHPTINQAFDLFVIGGNHFIKCYGAETRVIYIG